MPNPAYSMTPVVVETSPISPPTWPVDEAMAMVINLMRTNGDCKLPCWWGITPGETNSQEVVTFFERFRSLNNFVFDVNKDKGGFIYLEIPSSDLFVRLRMEYDTNTNDDTVERFFSIVIDIARKIDNGYESVYGDDLYQELMGQYMLPQILSTYGYPSQILLFGNRRAKVLNLMLAYPEDGFFINYESTLKNNGELFLSCPSKTPLQMTLWPPERTYTMGDIASVLFGKVNGPQWLAQYIPLQNATSLTPEEFYTIFRDHLNNVCLETPVDIWPEEP